MKRLNDAYSENKLVRGYYGLKVYNAPTVFKAHGGSGVGETDGLFSAAVRSERAAMNRIEAVN